MTFKNDERFIYGTEKQKSFSNKIDEDEFLILYKNNFFFFNENGIIKTCKCNCDNISLDPKLPTNNIHTEYHKKKRFMNDCLEKHIQAEIEKELLPYREEIEKKIKDKYHFLNEDS